MIGSSLELQGYFHGIGHMRLKLAIACPLKSIYLRQMTNPYQECISPDDCEAIENHYSCEHRPSFWNLKKRNEHQEYLNISVIQFFAALGLAFIIKLVFATPNNI